MALRRGICKRYTGKRWKYRFVKPQASAICGARSYTVLTGRKEAVFERKIEMALPDPLPLRRRGIFLDAALQRGGVGKRRGVRRLRTVLAKCLLLKRMHQVRFSLRRTVWGKCLLYGG